jgi:DNA topoisomerase I
MKNQRILVLAEKPDAAKKIAEALSINGRDFSAFRHLIEIPRGFDGNHYTVCSALGHLYELSDPHQMRNLFPVLDIDWFPRTVVASNQRRWGHNSGMNALVGQKIKEISRISRECSSQVNACDYDMEGETIGFNSLIFAHPVRSYDQEILRAKFSTLTVEDIRTSFRKLTSSDPKVAGAGRMRHLADFLWGVNLSRALTLSSSFPEDRKPLLLTVGRVQGPALSFVVDREWERRIHVPVPRWQVSCELEKSRHVLTAFYVDNPIRKYAVAREIHRTTSGTKEAIVTRVERTSFSIPPRYPFHLTELQKEAFKLFKLSPKTTLSIAQKLYQKALISYPRTDSQKLPEGIAFEQIFTRLSALDVYADLLRQLRSNPKRRFRPVQGPREDPAHPAIYPTGELPGTTLYTTEKKVYDLIVRRFLNAFAPNEIVEKLRVTFHTGSFDFSVESATILEKGWALYYPYTKGFENFSNVSFKEGEKVKVLSSSLREEYDPKPSRFTEASLLSRMERESIGTKATRADIIATLSDREYIQKENLELLPTAIGTSLIENVRGIAPEITAPEMTRALEQKLDRIRTEGSTDVDFVSEMLSAFRPVMKKMQSRNLEFESKPRVVRRLDQENLELGPCPFCKRGTLQLIRSMKTGKRFIRCSNFEKNCKTSSAALPRGQILPIGEPCPRCQWPMISIKFGAKRVRRTCSNFNCSSREIIP